MNKAATADEDYSEFDDSPADTSVKSDKLAQLQKLAQQQRDAEMDVIKCEKALADAQTLVRKYSENLIPSMMADLKLTEFKTQSGMTIGVEEKIRASIPAAMLQRTLVWLRENGHSALIKHVISMDFSMGEDEKAAALLKKLESEGFTPEEKENVHPSTLLSFVKTKLEKGEDLPDDLFSIFRQDVAKLTLPKKK